MTSPEVEQQNKVPIPTPPPEQEEADSLIPVLAMIVSAYLGWRAAHNRAEKSRVDLLAPLGIPATASVALERTALRVLTWQRTSHGRAGDELLPFVSVAVAEGVAAGIEVIEDTIVDWDDDERMDVMENRPRALAALARAVARAVGNAAMACAALGAGWRTKIWMTQQDSRVRSTHRGMQGQRRPVGEPFTTSDGRTIAYPGDPSVAGDLWIGCRCWMITERQ